MPTSPARSRRDFRSPSREDALRAAERQAAGSDSRRVLESPLPCVQAAQQPAPWDGMKARHHPQAPKRTAVPPKFPRGGAASCQNFPHRESPQVLSNRANRLPSRAGSRPPCARRLRQAPSCTLLSKGSLPLPESSLRAPRPSLWQRTSRCGAKRTCPRARGSSPSCLFSLDESLFLQPSCIFPSKSDVPSSKPSTGAALQRPAAAPMEKAACRL